MRSVAWRPRRKGLETAEAGVVEGFVSEWSCWHCCMLLNPLSDGLLMNVYIYIHTCFIPIIYAHILCIFHRCTHISHTFVPHIPGSARKKQIYSQPIICPSLPPAPPTSMLLRNAVMSEARMGVFSAGFVSTGHIQL